MVFPAWLAHDNEWQVAVGTAVERLALLMPSFRGGGAERVMLTLAGGFADQGLAVDLLVAQMEGAYVSEVPATVRTIDLRASRVLAATVPLLRYLRAERPRALLSALSHMNVVAIWARAVARVETRLVVSEHNLAGLWLEHAVQRRARLLPTIMRWTYGSADAIVTVSDGLADDLATSLHCDRTRITRIYNPVVTPKLFALADEPVEHSWFAAGEPPVVVAAGRLTKEKDFATLLRAVALVQREREVRLMILGEGIERQQLEALASDLAIATTVALPGFVANPFRYMRRAAVFVLSSRSEGFGNVLVEAMACGTPVVSTDCPSGPGEILQGGRFGRLVPIGDAKAMADAIVAQLDGAHTAAAMQRARTFSLDAALEGYRRALAL